MLTGTYYLTKDEKDTDISVTLQIAMKIEENVILEFFFFNYFH